VANNVNVVNRGFEYLSQFLALSSNNTSNGGWTVPSFIGWGGANNYNNASTAVPASGPTNNQGTGQWSDVGPCQEFSEARTAGTVTIISDTVASGTIGTQWVGTITASTGRNVGESFLCMSSTKPGTTTVTGNQTSTAATSLTVASTVSVNGYYQMNNEVIKVSSTTGTGPYTCTIARAQNASVANTAGSGDTITYGNPPNSGNNNPLSGDIFAHAGFQNLVLNSGDSIQFTWQVNITS
jgi:hypothetical protein